MQPAPVPLWPPEASVHAHEVDLVIWAFTLLLVFLTAPVFFLLIFYGFRYRRGRAADRSEARPRNVRLETAWMLVPFVLALIFCAWGARLYIVEAHPPKGALEIQVLAKQWMWKFEHPGGQREIDVLHVPVDRPVKLTMTSQDVIHSLFIPALRIKQDVLPGRYTTLWFTANRPGHYHLLCAEFCGTDHAVMGGAFVAQTARDYQAWLAQAGTDGSLAAQGAVLFRKLGCSGCHGGSGVVRAPDLRGLYGAPVPLSDGTTTVADARYIRDSILFPERQVAAGFKPVMPSFRNRVSEDELLKLIDYVKSLNSAEGTP